ncbi:relaxase/mobilization nuclease domain-containing protein [Amycolatopsis sp. VC5-11]|uniref:relaxase/mobilization nuclease domain-containing protein n=1 Tax=Amycolatopsis sp. VC5-11 TaxID=3120156 RepID=UPI0030089AAD
MIANANRGWRPYGLLRYLFGPGKNEEHRNPRVVASWDGAPHLHHPPKLGPGEHDFDLGALKTTMEELAEAAGLPLNNPPPITPEWEARLRNDDVPPDAPSWLRFYRYDRNEDRVVASRGYVWHTPVRVHPTDRILTDAEWETIAERLMKAAGIQQAGCRWIAVRHGDDHIHLVATLVSETTGHRFHPSNDYPKMRKECQKIERELGLYRTAGADKTAQRTPTRAEKAKAARLGRRETAREQLRRIVRQCAAGTRNGEEFLVALAQEGLSPRTTHDAAGRIRGYSVRLPGDVSASGEPIPWSGTKLAGDLTWPKLVERWASVPPVDVPLPRTEDGHVAPADRRRVLTEAADIARDAVDAIRRGSEDPAAIAHGTGEVVAALARGREGHELGLLTDVSERFDRAARTPHRVLPSSLGPVARDLRRASRQIARAGALTGRGNEKAALVALVLALVALIAEVAAWQQARGQVHQAAAARTAAERLPAFAESVSPVRGGPRTTPVPSDGRARPNQRPSRYVGVRRGGDPGLHRPT